MLTGDDRADFDAFQNLTPNGLFQLHLQSLYGQATPTTLDLEVKDVRIRHKDGITGGLVGRLNGLSGFGRRFGTPFSTQDASGADPFILYDTNGDGTTAANEFANIRPTDQLQRFDQNGFLANNSFIIKTDDDGNLGGFGAWQDPHYQTFDGSQATLKVTAKLTQAMGAGVANQIDVVLNDIDGNDNAGAGSGGEEYRYVIDLTQFNTATYTTIEIPLASFSARNQAFELVNSGDSLLTDFNLYYIGMVTLPEHRHGPPAGAKHRHRCSGRRSGRRLQRRRQG